MTNLPEKIKQIEAQIDKALWELEVQKELEKALLVYQEAEKKLVELSIDAAHPAYKEQQRVLSYCLMREGNLLRQLGKPHEAIQLGKREIAVARACGDQITLARSLMSNGTNLIVTRDVEAGLRMLEESRQQFENGDSFDHLQGLGWYWILQADLANAGLMKKDPGEVIEFATRALELLKPIENWPGIARALAARATVYEKLGLLAEAAKDREEQEECESKVNPEL